MKKKTKLINFIGALIVFFIVYDLIKFHPYESLYFNTLARKSSSNFQIDMPSLSRSAALKIILQDKRGGDNENIKVATAAFTSLKNGADMLLEKDKKKFSFFGQEYDKADYIYTNNIYNFNLRKYEIPSNFFLYKELIINKVKIYKIYKKK